MTEPVTLLCPNCNGVLPGKNPKSCPHCNHQLQSTIKTKITAVITAVGAFLGLIMVGLIAISLFGHHSNKTDSSSVPTRAESNERKLTAVEKREAEIRQQREQEEQKRLSTCMETIDSKKKEYAALMAKRRYFDAAMTLQDCSALMNDSSVAELYKKADIKAHEQIINDQKESVDKRIATATELITRYPETEPQYKKRLEQMESQAASKRKARERAERKKEGVAIGMSKQDVLQSSWGKPQRINVTTTPRGIHEQWVYGLGNYLYFENDVLVSIQTTHR